MPDEANGPVPMALVNYDEDDFSAWSMRWRRGPELFSAVFDTLDAEEIARRCHRSVSWALDL